MITGIRGLLHFPFTPCRKNIHDPPAGYLSNPRKRRLCLYRCLSVHDRERAWQGACMGALGHVWRGASYWNAFLFKHYNRSNYH